HMVQRERFRVIAGELREAPANGLRVGQTLDIRGDGHLAQVAADGVDMLPAAQRATMHQTHVSSQPEDPGPHGAGVVFILPATTGAGAPARMESVPLAQAHLVDHEYVALSPLGPLAALLGPPPGK